MDVVMAVDDSYVAPATVTVLSLVRAIRTRGDRLRLHLIDSGLSPDRKDEIDRSLSPFVDLVLYPAPRRLSLNLSPGYNDYLSSASMHRLNVGELLPAQLGRVLYLDADLVVQEDPGALWSADLEGRCVGAVRDAGWPTRHTFVTADGKVEERYDGAAAPGYFNSGVLLIDLPRWRDEGIFEKCVRLHDAVGDELRAPDQDILNMVLRSAWTPLSPRWNHLILRQKASGAHQVAADKWRDFLVSQAPGPQREEWARYLEKRQGIIHYSGRNKPWQDQFPDGPLKELFAEHARAAQDMLDSALGRTEQLVGQVASGSPRWGGGAWP